MNINNRLPAGFSDTVGEDAHLENKIIQKFSDLFRLYNYFQIKPSIFDYTENLYMETNGAASLFKTIDNNGNTLGILKDITPSVMRIIEGEAVPQRIFYFEKGYSFMPQDDKREIINAGLQLYNINGIEAEVEIILTAMQALREIGIADVKIILNHTTIIKNIVKSFHPDKNFTLKSILDAIKNNDNTAVGEVCFNIINAIYNGKGALSVLEKAASGINNKEALGGIVSLFRIYQLLSECGFEKQIEFDFSYFDNIKPYFNGTVFKILGQDLVLADGGRLNGMKYNKIVSAVVANYNMQVLIEYLKQSQKAEPKEETVLLAVEDSTIALAKCFHIRETLKEQNIKVLPVYKADRNICKQYAQMYNIENIIYIDHEGNVGN